METWRGMEDVVKKELAKHIGLSNVPVGLLHELLSNDLKIQPAVLQVELHPYLQQNKTWYDTALQREIQVQAYSPLGTPGYKEVNEPVLLEDLKDIATSGIPAPSRHISVGLATEDIRRSQEQFKSTFEG